MNKLNVKRKFLFLDRDGTLIDHIHHLADAEKIKIKKEAVEILRRLKDDGWRFLVITNQSVIALGIASAEVVNEINSIIVSEFAKHDIYIEAVKVCPHSHKDMCECRKPKTKLGEELISEFNVDKNSCWMVGDQQSDIDFAKALAIRGFRVIESNEKTNYHFEGSWEDAYVAISGMAF